MDAENQLEASNNASTDDVVNNSNVGDSNLGALTDVKLSVFGENIGSAWNKNSFGTLMNADLLSCSLALSMEPLIQVIQTIG